MAVFTTFTREALARYLIMFNLGELNHYEPIQGGIENSNYFVDMEDDGEIARFVLTIAEQITFDDVPFFNDLMSHLFHRGLPVPAPQRTLDGMTNTIFCGKPTSLFPRLAGSHPALITTGKCQTIGTKLAEIHVLAEGARHHRSNPYSSTWVNETLARVKDRLSSQDASLLHEIAKHYALMEEEPDLPRGIIHGDLFTDNALFVDEDLTGIIDFYHACDDFLIQDIAITINDWCSTPQGESNEKLERALIEGYQTVREITKVELQYLVTFQQFAALRFVLTRFISGEEEKPLKDPEEFLRIARRLKNQESGSID